MRSNEKWKSMKINIGRNIPNLTSIDGNFVCKHARSRNFDGVCPIIVIVTQSICEIDDCIFWNLRGVLSNIKMGWFDCSLCYWVRYEEEIKDSIHNFWLFNESLVNVRSLWGIHNLWVLLNLEESLSHSLVYYYKSVFWKHCIFICINAIFYMDNLVQLFKFIGDNLLSHWISNSVSVNEYVVG